MSDNTKKASPSFEKMYNPGEQHFDLENIREKNISKIEKLIAEKEALNKKYASLKRNVLVRVNAAFKDNISQKELDKKNEDCFSLDKRLEKEKRNEKELDKKIEDRFSKLDECLEKAKRNIENKIRAEIIHQSKMLLVLQKNEDIYNYYKLITEKPMPGKYAELEQRLYREFLMKNRAIETIIISCSELDDKGKEDQEETTELDEAKEAVAKARQTLDANDLNEAIAKVEALPDSEEKNELLEEIELIKKIIEATKAMNAAETSLDPQLWDKAETLIRALPNCAEKNQLASRFTNLLTSNENKIDELLAKLEEDIEEQIANNNTGSLYTDEVTELSDRWKLSTRQDELKDRVEKVIRVNNANVGHERKQKIAEEKPQKIGFKTMLTEFLGFPINVIRRSRAWGKHILKKITKKQDKLAKTTDDKKKQKIQSRIDKYDDLYHQRDIVSGVKLYKSLNTINKLKPAIYKDGLSASKNSVQRRYKNASITATNKLYNGLTRMYGRENAKILSDLTRFRNTADQYLEMLSVSPIANEEEFNEDVKEVKDFLNAAMASDQIEDEEVLAYLEEVDNIVFYKNFYKDNKQYEYTDQDIDEIYSNENNGLPYIKKHN